MAGTLSMVCLILITLLFPPIGVLLISGCSVDFLINILLTLLGYLPGHIHAFYLEYVYYNRRNMDPLLRAEDPAPGVYSERILHGGHHGTTQYGATQQAAPQYGAPQPGAPQYGAHQHGATQYGTTQYGATS